MTLRDLPAAPAPTRLPDVRSEAPDAVKARWNRDVRAASEGNAEISVLDVIGADFWGEGVTATRVAAALRHIGPRDVVVNINSPGGDVFEGLAIYNLLREHNGRVTVKVLGLAASAASIIAMAGDEVLVARAGFLMIHNTWVLAVGDRNALRETADMLEPFDRALADIYAARARMDLEDVAAMLDKETWIGGSAAVEQGFADGLLPSDQIMEAPQERASALRRADTAMAKAGLPRAERRSLLKEISATPGAGSEGTPSAAEGDADGIDNLRLAAARLSLLRA